MKNFYVLFFTLITVIPALAQTGSIRGVIKDAQNNEMMPYVNIVVKSSDKKIVTGGISNDKGSFGISKIPYGKYTAEIQFMGYETISKPVELNDKRRKLNLGVIRLSASAEMMSEVELTEEASTIEQKIDRKVINVGKDLTSVGSTAGEMLNQIQSVNVDQQTGSVSLRGNENVRILIDGKPTNLTADQVLKQIPSASIKKVELITNPSAKYNPEGMSGMINLVLHKNALQGFNANVNAGLTQGINTRFNGSLNMNYKTGKVNIYSNYGYNTGTRENKGYVNRTDKFPLRQEFGFENTPESHMIKLGADYYINDQNTLSAYTTQNFFKTDNDGFTRVIKDQKTITDAPYIVSNTVPSQTYNLNYRRKFDKNGQHQLDAEITYSHTNNEEDARYWDKINTSSKDLNFTNDVEKQFTNTIFNIDYNRPIGDKSKLELGAEYRQNLTTNENISTQLNVGNSAFEYDRNIYSLYATFGHQFEKVGIQLGSRFEQYEVEGTFSRGKNNAPYSDEIFSIYPSAYITYNPSEKNQYQLSYSRRVDRPSIGQVNPVREWSTPLINSVGNPELVPQFTNSYEFNYTRQFKKGNATAGVFYRRITDPINRFISLDPKDPQKQLLTYANLSPTDRFGIELSSSYAPKRWWRLNGSVELYNKTDRQGDLEVVTNSLSGRLSSMFYASKKLNFQVFTMINAPENGIQFNRKTMWMFNLGASYTVLNGKGTISARVNDIFQGMRFKFDSTNPFEQNGQFNWESRTFYVGFNYRFGQGKNRALRRKNRDSNELRSGGGFGG
ncbi:MAG: TonB-dependent receptor family protein [Flavobacteriales bacterium]|jgi:outer membrane receptor protein involved in Fe transport|nr:TonB-dependent receptor family protein [Flavobacteriales bacterium]